MADFFGNLILRSAIDPSPPALLQPRLPSLFEPLVGANEIPMPEPILRETAALTNDPAASASPIVKLPAARSTIVDEPAARQRTIRPTESHAVPAAAPPIIQLPAVRSTVADEPAARQPTVKSVEHQRPPATAQVVPSPMSETQQNMSPPVQPSPRLPGRITKTVQSMSHPREPQTLRAILPRPESQAAQKELPAIEERRSTPKERGKTSPAEPLSVNAQKAEATPLPTKRMDDSFKATINPPKEDSISADSARPMPEPASVKTGPKPAAVLQPIPTASHSARIQQSEQASEREPQRVVEIHIGRIEVRAAPPTTPLKRAAQKAATMSLDEYLRSRPGEKQ
jgi:hypothetical protein